MKRVLALAAAASALLAAASSASPGSVTGFGATVRAWNATHTMDRRGNLVPGCCYDPVANRPGLLYADRYYAVQPIGGHVISYYEWLGNGTSAKAAKAAALQQLPADARIKSFTAHGNTCAILIVNSRKLGNLLGRGGAEVVVEFGSGADESHYNPKSVNNLLFSSGLIAGATAQNC